MADSPKCKCGCGTDLKQRKDGSYADYAPGGHDAKHKSALIKAVLADEDPIALAYLKSRSWDKYLDKARETAAKKSKAAAAKADPARHSKPLSATDNSARFGLTVRDLVLLDTPPTETTWYCTEPHGEEPGSEESLIINRGSSDECWFCRTKRPADAPLVFPLFEEALERLARVDMESLLIAGLYPSLGDTLAWAVRAKLDDGQLLARKIVGLHRRWIEGNDEPTTEEVNDGAEISVA